MTEERGEITRLLQDLEDANPSDRDRAWRSLYGEVIRIAHGQRARWHGDWTLETRALANEMFIRCFGNGTPRFEDRLHFFRVMSTTIRRILINYAEQRGAEKRGGKVQDLQLQNGDWIDLSPEAADQIIDLHRALERFEATDARASEIVRLKFFLGLSIDEIAEVLGVSRATVGRDWASARAWLWREMEGPPPAEDD